MKSHRVEAVAIALGLTAIGRAKGKGPHVPRRGGKHFAGKAIGDAALRNQDQDVGIPRRDAKRMYTYGIYVK